MFSVRIKQFLKVIFVYIFLQIYNFIIFCGKVVHILLNIFIVHYIFLISFGTTKTFKFQISHSPREIIMIIKNYHIITIDITQIIDKHIQIK